MSDTNAIILLFIVGVITFLNFLFFLSIDEHIKSFMSSKNIKKEKRLLALWEI